MLDGKPESPGIFTIGGDHHTLLHEIQQFVPLRFAAFLAKRSSQFRAGGSLRKFCPIANAP
jgi:hypothetical protein